MTLKTITVEVPAADAPSLRDVLDARRLDGLTYTSRTPWQRLWLDTVFKITAPPRVLASLEAQIEAWRSEMWADRQW